ncbi:MAG: hypothetical protein ACTSRZ_12010 [Promethearchaeota archaeon]
MKNFNNKGLKNDSSIFVNQLKHYNHPKNGRIRKNKLSYLIVLMFVTVPLAMTIFSFNIKTQNVITLNKDFNLTTSALTYDFNITLTSLSPSSAYHGQTVTLYGNAKRWNYGSSSWEYAVGDTIYLIIDDQPRTDLNGIVNGAGNFQIPFQVDSSWNINKDIIISANVSSSSRTAKTWFPQSLDVNAYTQIVVEDNSQLPAMKYSTIPYAGFTNYHLSARLDLTNGSTYSGPPVGLNLNYGSGSTTVYTDPDGICAYDFYWSGESSYTWSFTGNDNLSSAGPVTKNYRVFSGFQVDFLDTENIAYQNYTFFVRGQIQLTGYPDIDRSSIGVQVSFVGQTIYADCNVNGVFSTTFNIPDTFEGQQTLEVKIVIYNGEDVYEANLENPTLIRYTTTFEVRSPSVFDKPNAISPALIIAIVIIVGILASIIIFMRIKLKREAVQERLNIIASIEEKLSYVRLLLEAGRKKEAIGYLWLIYSQMAAAYYGIEKTPSQTPKNFAILLVREYGQNPASLYPFIQKIEQAVYGTTPINEEYFNDIVKSFRKVYLELTGRMLTTKI